MQHHVGDGLGHGKGDVGQGWIKVPKEACEDIQGGSLTPPAEDGKTETPAGDKK